MTLSLSQIKTVRHQFDCFCKKVLREESRDYERQLARRREKETTFSDLPESVINQIGERDEYPSDHTYFDVLDYHIVVKNEQLAKALASLPSKKRDVILLAFFFVDDEKRKRLEIKLITKILDFEILKAA